MQQEQLAQASPLTTERLKELSAVEGPCLTVLLSLPHRDTREIGVKTKKTVQEIEEKLRGRGLERDTLDRLMSPLREFAVEVAGDREHNGIVIFRSSDVFAHYYLPHEVEDCAAVSDHFLLSPLFPALEASRPFYILALSQKHIRLLRCDGASSQEVDLPPEIPHDLDEFIGSDKPDHVLDNASSGGPSMGAGRVMFGTGNDKERRDQYLLHFYKRVDDGVTELLKNGTAPLVLAGVDYELSLYRNESKFPRLAEGGVHGAPDGLKGGELHKRALEVVQPYWDKEVDAALAMYEQFGGSARSSVSLKEIVKAAYDGRVLHLFVARGASHMGNFDEMTHKVRAHGEEQPGDEDLVNAAAVETVKHGGDVFVVARNKVPHGGQMAAVMRY